MQNDTVTITLSRNDLGQIIDGLIERADLYARTAEYHESGSCDGEIAEVSDADEARSIEATYNDIISKLQAAR